MTLPTQEIQSLSPSALVSLYELDYTNIGGEKVYFHSGVNGLGNDITWQGIKYTRYPVEISGLEKTGTGTLPRPVLKVANIYSAISGLVYAFDDLIGAKLIRRKTFAKYLDAINFPGGINNLADPTVAFPDEIWVVDRKSSENGIFVEFELAAAFDVAGVKLPRRQCIQNMCTWQYRSPECGYTGGPVATTLDTPTGDTTKDKCGKRLYSCKLRFGETSELPFGGFPGVGLIK